MKIDLCRASCSTQKPQSKFTSLPATLNFFLNPHQFSKEQRRPRCQVQALYFSKGKKPQPQNPNYINRFYNPHGLQTWSADWYRNRYLAETHSLLFSSWYVQEETCWAPMLIPNVNDNWPLKFQWQSCRAGKIEEVPHGSRRGLPGTSKTRRYSCTSLSLQSWHSWGEHPGKKPRQHRAKRASQGSSGWCCHNSTNVLRRQFRWRTVVEGALSGDDEKCWAVSHDLQHGWLAAPSPRALALQSCWMTF